MAEFFSVSEKSMIVSTETPIRLLLKNKSASAVCIGSVVETIQTAGSDVDRLEATAAAQYSKTALGIVLSDEINYRTLGKNNQTPTKDTQFAANDPIWVGLAFPGVVETILAAQQGTILSGKKMCCGGSGSIQVHPDNLAPSTHTTGTTLTNTMTGYALDITCAIALGRYTTSDATQRIQVRWLW
jgi:hypothetical protein